jgi:hypothetical protein
MANAKDLTIFYTKREGRIHSYATGVETMSYHGVFELDYVQILDIVVVPYDPEITKNIVHYAIDLETKALILSATGEATLTKYKKVKKIG